MIKQNKKISFTKVLSHAQYALNPVTNITIPPQSHRPRSTFSLPSIGVAILLTSALWPINISIASIRLFKIARWSAAHPLGCADRRRGTCSQ